MVSPSWVKARENNWRVYVYIGQGIWINEESRFVCSSSGVDGLGFLPFAVLLRNHIQGRILQYDSHQHKHARQVIEQ